MALDERLKGQMKRIASIGSLVNGYEHFNYDQKSQVLGIFPRVAAQREQDIPSLEDELEGYEDVARYKFMNGILSSESNRIKPDYERNLDEILSEIVGKLNSDLNEVENLDNPLEAISKIAYAFLPLVEKRNPTQGEADDLMRGEFSERYGVRFKNVKGANPEEYKDRFLSLQARSMVFEYLKENKDKEGKVIGYSIDKDKLGELIKENPQIGSLLYLAKKPQEREQAANRQAA